MSEYGRYLAFPFHIGSDGRAAQVTSLDAHIRDEVIQLLLTNLGERAFLPEFGGNVGRLVFEPLSEARQAETKAIIAQAMGTWLGHRVSLESLEVDISGSQLAVEIKYRITGTDESRVLRFQQDDVS